MHLQSRCNLPGQSPTGVHLDMDPTVANQTENLVHAVKELPFLSCIRLLLGLFLRWLVVWDVAVGSGSVDIVGITNSKFHAASLPVTLLSIRFLRRRLVRPTKTRVSAMQLSSRTPIPNWPVK